MKLTRILSCLFVTFLQCPLALGRSTFRPTPTLRPHGQKRPVSNVFKTFEEQEQEETKEVIDAFLTRDSRNTFIEVSHSKLAARVYGILSVQLAVTAASVVYFGINPKLVRWMLRPGLGQAVPLLSFLVSLSTSMYMSFSEKARQKGPLKWQLLTLFTLGESIIVGLASSRYKFQSVCTSMLATAVATAAVSIYTVSQKNSKYDLSQWGAGLSSALMIFLALGIMKMLQAGGIIPAGWFPISESLYALAGSILFSFYLAYDTKLIVGGKHSKYQMNEKDYVFGAISLYLDIINIFIYILRFIGEDRD